MDKLLHKMSLVSLFSIICWDLPVVSHVSFIANSAFVFSHKNLLSLILAMITVSLSGHKPWGAGFFPVLGAHSATVGTQLLCRCTGLFSVFDDLLRSYTSSITDSMILESCNSVESKISFSFWCFGSSLLCCVLFLFAFFLSPPRILCMVAFAFLFKHATYF